MPKSSNGLTAKEIERRLKQGRGKGSGSAYLPFITVRDISSKGRSHRLFSSKTQRVHHLLSDLELYVFLTLEWSRSVIDIREQFPLNVDETVSLASEARIAHSEYSGVYQVMTTDFVVDMVTPERPRWALSAKYAVDLDDPRTIEKQELERRYWHQKATPWFLVTEEEIPQAVIDNCKWLFAAQSGEIDEQQLRRYFELFEHAFRALPDSTLRRVATHLDTSCRLPPGEALLWLRYLLARRYFSFDITQPPLKIKAADVRVADLDFVSESYRAAS